VGAALPSGRVHAAGATHSFAAWRRLDDGLRLAALAVAVFGLVAGVAFREADEFVPAALVLGVLVLAVVGGVAFASGGIASAVGGFAVLVSGSVAFAALLVGRFLVTCRLEV